MDIAAFEIGRALRCDMDFSATTHPMAVRI